MQDTERHPVLSDSQVGTGDIPVVAELAKDCRVPSDAELLARCRRRDASAWDLLVSRYERLVFSVALRNGVTPEDADDITQTTFVALIDSLNKIQDDDKLASWLMVVARRQAWRVRNAARRVIPIDSVPEVSEDPFANWGDLTMLHESLSMLGGPCKDLLEALYLDPAEPSYADIAERFGRAIGSIGPMRGRCLYHLRTIMSEGMDS